MGQIYGCHSVKRSSCSSLCGLLWKRCFLMNGKCVFRSLFHCTVQDNEFQLGANDVGWDDAARLDVAFACPCTVWTLPHFKAVSNMALANRGEQASGEPRLRWRHNTRYGWKGPDRPTGFGSRLSTVSFSPHVCWNTHEVWRVAISRWCPGTLALQVTPALLEAAVGGAETRQVWLCRDVLHILP